MYLPLLLVMLAGWTPEARAYNTATVNGIKWTYTVSNGTATVGGGIREITAVPTNTSGAIVIPSKLGGYPVTGIADEAFYWCCGLKSVTIPASVARIAETVFSGYSGYPGDCNLTNIVVAANNATYASKNGVLFDKGMKTLVQYPGGKRGAYDIPDGVTSIGAVAFYCSHRMSAVTMPSSGTDIGGGRFSNVAVWRR